LTGPPAFDAAVFDLFGTLVPEFPRSEFYGVVRQMATILGADEASFVEAWSGSAVPRQTGAYPGGVEENVRSICAMLGLAEPSDDVLARALAPRSEMYRRWFRPRPGAVETLREVRARGYRSALISMCAPDTPAMWRASALAPFVDVEVFSSETGLRKPDPAIYLSACERLGVPPERCLYCGDGAYAELSGAEAVGMTAVEIREPDVDHAEQLRPEGEDWTGERIAHLRELLERLPPRRATAAGTASGR
jgi:putative hydrolase of the HAD superfamily